MQNNSQGQHKYSMKSHIPTYKETFICIAKVQKSLNKLISRNKYTSLANKNQTI